MSNRPLTVAWISFFPIEWLPDAPEHLRSLPRQHPASWQRVLLGQLECNPDIRLHVIILRKHFNRSEMFKRNDVVFHLVKTIGGLRALSFFWLDTWLIRSVLKSIKPDVVHAWGTENGAALVAARLGYPRVVTMQGLLTWLAQLVPLNWYFRFTAFLEDFSLRRASLVTAESSFAVKYLKQRHPHLNLRQVEHAPLPVFQQVVRRLEPGPVRFLFVGSFSFAKGADVMLRALDGLKAEFPFELRVAGHTDAREMAAFQALASAGLWRRIRFLGSITAEKIAGELGEANFFIYPSRCDNSPNAVKEAVVAGVPVIATAVGGIVDYVFPGRNGFLFRSGDVEDCQSAIRQACAHPLFSKGLVDGQVLEQVRAYLSVPTMARQFLEIYQLAVEPRCACTGSNRPLTNPPDGRLI